MPTKNKFFCIKFFWILLFEVLLHHFSKKKSQKEVTKQSKSRFFLLFLLSDRRIRSRIHTSDYWIRIQEAQKHVDPDSDPQHCLKPSDEITKSAPIIISSKAWSKFLNENEYKNWFLVKTIDQSLEDVLPLLLTAAVSHRSWWRRNIVCFPTFALVVRYLIVAQNCIRGEEQIY